MLSRITVSQNRIPGSADFHALCTIFDHNLCASISLVTLGFLESTGYCWWYWVPSTTDFINSSSILTETLAPVTLPDSNLASINDSASGCLIDTDNMSAPLRPS